jgi:hypothetical protein
MTPSQRRRSRIAHFQQPFLVGVATSAVALGCGGKSGEPEPSPEPAITDFLSGTVSECPSVACNPPGPDQAPLTECPAGAPPAPDTLCANEGLICGDSCDGTVVTCQGGRFVATLVSCNPPEPLPDEVYFDECPQSMPAAGSSCAGAGTCVYPGCAGEDSNTAQCVFEQWVVRYSSGPACNPPEVVPVCPDRTPEAGALCFYRQSCEYADCLRATCDGTWSLTTESGDAPVGADAGAGSADAGEGAGP